MKNKKYIISVIIVIVINAAALGFWLYFFSKISFEKTAVQNLREKVKISEERIKNSRSLGILLKNIEHDQEKISAIFLNPNNFVGFVEKLEFISKKSGAELAIENVRLPDSSVAEKPQIKLRVKGTFRDVFYYLSLFENIPYKMEVGKLNLAKSESDKKTVWRADMEIKILSYKNI